MTITNFLALDQGEQNNLISKSGDIVMEFIQGPRTVKIYKVNELLIKVETTTNNNKWVVAPYNAQEHFCQFDITH